MLFPQGTMLIQECLCDRKSDRCVIGWNIFHRTTVSSTTTQPLQACHSLGTYLSPRLSTTFSKIYRKMPARRKHLKNGAKMYVLPPKYTPPIKISLQVNKRVEGWKKHRDFQSKVEAQLKWEGEV